MTEARLGNQYRCAITDADGNVIYSEPAELRTVTKKWSYTYDSDGLRTAKSDGATNCEYIYDGDKLVQMNVGTDILRFAYDGSTPMTVTFNGAVYYYITNLQGDIVAILDSTGSKVVEYTYNAWDLPLTTTGSTASTLGRVAKDQFFYVYQQIINGVRHSNLDSLKKFIKKSTLKT